MRDEYTLKLGPNHRTMGPGGSRELIGAGFMRKKPGKDHTNYEPPFYSLCYVIEGRGAYTSKYGTFDLTAGSYFQRFPGIRHSTVIHPPCDWSECFIDFGAGLYGILCQMGMIDPSQPCGFAGIDKTIPDSIANFCRTLNGSDTQSLKLLMPQMLELNQRILSSGGAEKRTLFDTAVSHLAQILGKDFESRLDIRQICIDNGWGYEKMRKQFKSAMGISPARYRIRTRLDEAKRLLLADRDIPLSVLAERLGYKSVYEFSAQFKKNIGSPPARFRKRLIRIMRRSHYGY